MVRHKPAAGHVVADVTWFEVEPPARLQLPRWACRAAVVNGVLFTPGAIAPRRNWPCAWPRVGRACRRLFRTAMCTRLPGGCGELTRIPTRLQPAT